MLTEAQQGIHWILSRNSTSLPNRPLLNPPLIQLALKNPLHINRRSMHRIPIQLPSLHQILDLGNRDPSRRSHHRVKIPRRLPVNQIPHAVALPRAHKRKVRLQPAFHHISAPIELACLLAISNNRSYARRSKERRNPRASSPNALGKRSLRHKIKLHLSRKNHRFQQLVLADISSNMPPNLSRRQQ